MALTKLLQDTATVDDSATAIRVVSLEDDVTIYDTIVATVTVIPTIPPSKKTTPSGFGPVGTGPSTGATGGG